MSKKQSQATKEANLQRASDRAAAIRAEQERKERRTRTLLVSAVVVGVLILVATIAVAVQAGRDTTGQTSEAPSGVVEGYALPVGPADAPVTVTVYEDPMCPFCGVFEQVSSERLREYADAGDIQLRYHVVSFLDGASGTRYSTRAANAIAVVLDTAGAEVAADFHDALFANQPAEGTDGLSDDDFVALAVEAGAEEDAIRGPIESLKFEQWVKNSTNEWSERGFTGTPTVTVNDEKIEFQTAEELLANTELAIEEALAAEQ